MRWISLVVNIEKSTTSTAFPACFCCLQDETIALWTPFSLWNVFFFVLIFKQRSFGTIFQGKNARATHILRVAVPACIVHFNEDHAAPRDLVKLDVSALAQRILGALLPIPLCGGKMWNFLTGLKEHLWIIRCIIHSKVCKCLFDSKMWNLLEGSKKHHIRIGSRTYVHTFDLTQPKRA